MRRFGSGFFSHATLIAGEGWRLQSSSNSGGEGPLAEAQLQPKQEEQQGKKRVVTALMEEEATLTEAPPGIQYDLSVPYTQEDRMIEQKEALEMEVLRKKNEEEIKTPVHPSKLIPTYRRINKNLKMIRLDHHDPAYGKIERLENTVPLPQPRPNKWLPYQPAGPHIVHGDGGQGIVGHNDVGFDVNSKDTPATGWPTQWRGFQHHSVLGKTPSAAHGAVSNKMVIKHSLQLTGKGLFAQKDIKKGEHIMVVHSESVNLGYEAEINRLITMVSHTILKALEEGEEGIHYLHQWILTNQPSNMVERWPQDATDRVLTAIGGREILDRVELHPQHIAKLAAIVDMNSFLIESYFQERKGMAYFPEASSFNHSCVPNIDYDIIPSHLFEGSEYCPKLAEEQTSERKSTQTAFADDVEEDLDQESKANMKELETDLANLEEVPVYLFCCKANRDIKQGEEMLISYVPTNWRYDDRQQVLHHRYRFWCKCSKCSVTLDHNLNYLPRYALYIALVFAFFQLWSFSLGSIATDRWADVTAQGLAVEQGNTPAGGLIDERALTSSDNLTHSARSNLQKAKDGLSQLTGQK